MRMKKGPIVVMLVTAALTYEGLYRLFPDTPAPMTVVRTQLQAGIANMQRPAPYMTPAHMTTQTVSNHYHTRSMALPAAHKKILKHGHHSAQSEMLLEAVQQAKPEMDVTSEDRAEQIAHAELSVTAPTTNVDVSHRGPVDLRLRPQVIVLPKKEEHQVAGPMFTKKTVRLAKAAAPAWKEPQFDMMSNYGFDRPDND